MGYCAPKEVARCGAPGAVQEPREGDERDREVWRCDCYYAKERDARAWMSAGPDVDGDKGEWGREEGHVDKWG